eukprot:353711-Lingulodinium_polyedra.AAC.1
MKEEFKSRFDKIEQQCDELGQRVSQSEERHAQAGERLTKLEAGTSGSSTTTSTVGTSASPRFEPGVIEVEG